MKQFILLSAVILLIQSAFAQSSPVTRFELSEGKECGTYEEVIDFCQKLSDSHMEANYLSFGKSGRQHDLPMLIIDKQGSTDPGKVQDSGRSILMIQASIHPGEPDGTSAGLMLCRDLLEDKTKKALLENVTVLFIPILNVDGYIRRSPYNRINQNGPLEMGWRANAQNINLNRDYLRSESPETEAWHSVFEQWRPDFFVDCHTTDGADYQYAITYDLPVYGNMSDSQTKWLKEQYLEPLKQYMAGINFPMFRYVSFREWFNPESGISAWVSSPMLSQGYTAVKNRAGLLIETHMLKPYDIRVNSTYEALLESIKILNRESGTLRKINLDADNFTAGKAFRELPYPLEWASGDSSSKCEFLGIEYSKEKSSFTDGVWFKYNGKEKTYIIDFYDDMHPVSFARVPEAYIVPPEWTFVKHRLDVHGIRYEILKEDKKMDLSMLRLNNPEFAREPYEGAFRVMKFEADTLELTVNVPAHSIVVPTDQINAKVLIHLLDPLAPSSLLKWGYFNAIFEQKEYAEIYVMEKLAPKMLENDPALKSEYQAMIKEHPEILENQWQLMNWFYKRSEYWDQQKDLYPIGFLF